MAPGSPDTAAALQTYLEQHYAPDHGIEIYTPASADFAAVNRCFIRKPVRPAAVAQAASALDVQALVRFCLDRNVDFLVRSAGHECAGRTQAADVLVIDVKKLRHVAVDASRRTARVGGGARHAEVAAALEKEGLTTPIGAVAGVGYTGWATGGGYGPLSGRHGMGADQIVGARLVNAAGDLVDADDELLEGLRGGGGTFGAIVELTIKVFPLNETATGFVMFHPDDMAASWSRYAAAFRQWHADHEIPPDLYLQQLALPLPGLGPSFGVAIFWGAADDPLAHAEQWVERIAALGQPVVQQTAVRSLLANAEENDKIVQFGVAGRIYSLSFRTLTAATAAVLARYAARVFGSMAGISIHSLLLHGGAAEPPPGVFATRTDHFMLELLAVDTDEHVAEKLATWATDCLQDLRREDPDNILDESYVVLHDDDDSDYKKIYGQKYDRLVQLKTKFDPHNVFRHAIPKIQPAV